MFIIYYFKKYFKPCFFIFKVLKDILQYFKFMNLWIDEFLVLFHEQVNQISFWNKLTFKQDCAVWQKDRAPAKILKGFLLPIISTNVESYEANLSEEKDTHKVFRNQEYWFEIWIQSQQVQSHKLFQLRILSTRIVLPVSVSKVTKFQTVFILL